MLPTGTRLGPYEILSSLGAGGMGEVYRARDTKLGRDVALKILSQTFAGDPDRLARFQREAQTLASLNHPHIAQIHGLEESGDVRALVMELVEGEDLSQRIARGPLPLDEALPIAMQITTALEAAHEQGIIHRDLKPANIKLRPDGTIKVLDFGLAKELEGRDFSPGRSSAEAEASALRTVTSPAMTMRGVILGTAAYMPPEQAKGKTLDKRADIWAFGCVLFEMLTGRRAFAGDDVSDTLAFVLLKDVDWSVLPVETPANVRAVLRRCLQKDPKERLRDAGDLRLLLVDGMAAPHTTSSRGASLVPWTIAAVASVLAGIAGFVLWRLPASPPATAAQFVVQPPGRVGLPLLPALAPDGSFVAFAADRLYLQWLSEIEPRPLPGTENASLPFVSRDGRWLGFYADGKIKKITVAGGDPLPITEVDSETPGATWMHDNRILFTAGWNDTPLMSVSADGGAVTRVSTLDTARRERGHWWPYPLPDGRHVLFTIWYAGAGLSESQIAVLDLQTGTHATLFPGALARYAAGHLIYYRAGAYYIVPFDPETMRATGDPKSILPDAVALSPQGSNDAPLSVSDTGVVAYVAGDNYPERTLSWIARGGVEQPTSIKVRAFDQADLDDAGHRVATGRTQGGTSQVWIFDLVRGTEQRLAAPGMNWSPVWHPDGNRLDGSPPEPLLDASLDEEILDWMPDGKRLIVKEWRPDGHLRFRPRQQGTDSTGDRVLREKRRPRVTRWSLAGRHRQSVGALRRARATVVRCRRLAAGSRGAFQLCRHSLGGKRPATGVYQGRRTNRRRALSRRRWPLCRRARGSDRIGAQRDRPLRRESGWATHSCREADQTRYIGARRHSDFTERCGITDRPMKNIGLNAKGKRRKTKSRGILVFVFLVSTFCFRLGTFSATC